MYKGSVILTILCFLTGLQCSKNAAKKPNIIVIMADDLGSHDISLRGSNQIMTPNIDALGYQGIILNRHYTYALCTPSRAAFLTGKYPIHTGMQHFVINPDEPRGLPLNEKIMPQFLKEAGYSTHIVGKWHLGLARKAMIPTLRGFDSHCGYLGPYVDYFDYTLWIPQAGYPPGFDFRKNESIYRDRVGEYATDVFADEAAQVIRNHESESKPLFLLITQLAPHAANTNDPLQALPEDLEAMRHIRDPKRRTYAAMVKALDRSVGTVVTALKRKGMLDNTIILFFSDNGGPTSGLNSISASNYPLRGQKDSAWEGGLRNPAFIWSPLFLRRHYVSNHVVHITDWLPTFAQAAGTITYKFKKLDGFDIWQTISNNQQPLRRDIVHNINPIAGYSSYYRDGWKFVNGTTQMQYDGWLGNLTFEDAAEKPYYTKLVMESEVWQALKPYASKPLRSSDIEGMRREAKIECYPQIPPSKKCNPVEAPCLFYIDTDPCEMSNLAHFRPTRMEVMVKHIRNYQKTSLPPSNLPNDHSANPALHNGVWTWWLD
ncbi:arylsulfatase B [Sergentomyia squamirostris]